MQSDQIELYYVRLDKRLKKLKILILFYGECRSENTIQNNSKVHVFVDCSETRERGMTSKRTRQVNHA